jgi:tetratricopeptide (TPR) repeat protein
MFRQYIRPTPLSLQLAGCAFLIWSACAPVHASTCATVPAALSALTEALIPAAPNAKTVPDLEKAIQARAQGQGALARAQTKAALDVTPSSVEWRLFHSALLLDEGQWLPARTSLLALAVEYPELAAIQNNLAVSYAAEGHWRAALQALERALQADPKDETALRNLETTHLRLAEQALEARVTRFPREADAQDKLRTLRLWRASGTAAAVQP